MTEIVRTELIEQIEKMIFKNNNNYYKNINDTHAFQDYQKEADFILKKYIKKLTEIEKSVLIEKIKNRRENGLKRS